MANVTAYLHPERLLVASWIFENGVAVIQDYKELAPGATVDLRAMSASVLQLVIHSTHLRVHWYPVEEASSTVDRLQFEQQTWFEPSSFMSSEEVTMSTVIRGTAHHMKAAVAVAEQTLVRCKDLAGDNTSILTDYEMDVHAALASTKPRREPWMLLGRRGGIWHATMIGVDHTVISYAAFPHDNDYSNQAMTLLIVNAITQRYETPVTALLLYGDVITSDEIQEIKDSLAQQGIKSGRLQPFKAMQSLLDEKNAQRLLKRAHVVSPLAGAILQHQLLVTAYL